ncbi:hypothetical protein N7492_008208 [Penicillium capsulatum]|uniref:Uncharacterized protein n=1 Tax=Penicillium capsulatum TaxID=69766 RepID=A0A9W9HS69_9EURO|nr:hypothetical protein N7492_008208 [Penicillium capsulatum]KAJ6105618.1 hypothetical protein N7512_009135 [Penicillium capsulatum]
MSNADERALFLPPAQVNSEVRNSAVSWARERGVVSYYPRDKVLVFARRFDPTRDTIYIRHDQVMEPDEELDLLCKGPYFDAYIAGAQSKVERTALPAGVLNMFMDGLVPELAYCGIPSHGMRASSKSKELFLVVGEQPVGMEYSGDTITPVQPRWELGEGDGERFGWNSFERRFDTMDETLMSRELRLNIETTCPWGWEDMNGLEIWPDVAFRGCI